MTNMRAVHCPIHSDDGDDGMPLTAQERRIAANFAALKANKKRKVRDEALALETAALVQREVQRWQNSIRELEALIENGGGGGDPFRPPAAFALPVVIAVDDDDDDSRPAGTAEPPSQDEETSTASSVSSNTTSAD